MTSCQLMNISKCTFMTLYTLDLTASRGQKEPPLPRVIMRDVMEMKHEFKMWLVAAVLTCHLEATAGHENSF